MKAEQCSLPWEAMPFRPAPTAWLITWAAKLTFIASCTTGARWASLSLLKRQTILFLSHLYTFKMCSQLCSDRKLVVHELRLKLHIIFEEKVPGALQEVWRIIHCHNLSVLKLEEWLPSDSTQQFKALTLFTPMSQTVATTCSPAFWHAPRTSFKNLTNRSVLVLPRMK